MKLDYGTITSPYPILLSIGSIRKPTLEEIADQNKIGFQKFGFYENMMSMTPQQYYRIVSTDKDLYYASLSEEEQEKMTMFEAIKKDSNLQDIYTSIFRLFFIEPVFYIDGIFVILNPDAKMDSIDSQESIRGIINEDSFNEVLNILKQICGMQADDDLLKSDASKIKFKNEKARKLFEKMQNAKVKKQHASKNNINYSIPNIISVVCGMHPSINYTNVYKLTVYQLLDIFERMKTQSIFNIYRTQVSVWGNEKNWFDPELWYRNEYDKENESA